MVAVSPSIRALDRFRFALVQPRLLQNEAAIVVIRANQQIMDFTNDGFQVG